MIYIFRVVLGVAILSSLGSMHSDATKGDLLEVFVDFGWMIAFVAFFICTFI